MTSQIKIDFVSDVSCPWCAIGLASLDEALAELGHEVDARMHFQPFELNPDMPPEGRAIVEYLGRKYGLTPEKIEQNSAAIRARGREVGFVFNRRDHVYNTFDAHRLLCWAGREGRQKALKQALFKAYFTDGQDPSAHEVLIRAAVAAGLDAQAARDVLAGDGYAKEVRERERYYRDLGINAVPAVIVNDRHLIQGGQPVEVFRRALQQIAAGDDEA